MKEVKLRMNEQEKYDVIKELIDNKENKKKSFTKTQSINQANKSSYNQI